MARLGLAFLVMLSLSMVAEARPRRPMSQAEVYAAIARSAEVRADGTVEFRPPAWLQWRGNGVFSFGKGSEFREEKRAFLEATFEARLAMAARFRQRMAHASVGELPQRLAAIWCGDPETPPELKRATLHQMWEDAAEPEDPELGVHGARARAVIEQFVQVMLPPGLPVAFTREELMAWAQQRERAPAFNPYAPWAGLVAPEPAQPEHIDELDDDEVPHAAAPSEAVREEVAQAMKEPASRRRALLFAAWDDRGEAVDRAFVEATLQKQAWPAEEVRRFGKLRGDEAFAAAVMPR